MSEIPRHIFAVASGSQVPELLMDRIGAPVSRVEINDDDEPVESLAAFKWKTDQVSVTGEQAIYASDVTFIDDAGQRHGKPSRFTQLENGVGEMAIPDYILERYGRQSVAKWHVVFGFKMPDGTSRACQAYIQTQVPELTTEEIEAYYSSSSSAGLLLVKLLRDKYPETKYQLTAENGDPIATVSGETVWQLVVDKVPPPKLLKKLLYQESHDFASQDTDSLGLCSISLLELLQECNDNRIDIELKNGAKGSVHWIQPEDYESVSSMLEDNFRYSPSYAQLSEDAVAEYIRANSVDAIATDVVKEDVIAAYVVRDETSELVGYILVRNGKSKSSQGKSSAVIKRIHSKMGQVGNGIGETLLSLAEEAARLSGLHIMGVGASGTSRAFFQKRGYQCLETGENPILSVRGVSASWNYLEKFL